MTSKLDRKIARIMSETEQLALEYKDKVDKGILPDVKIVDITDIVRKLS